MRFDADFSATQMTLVADFGNKQTPVEADFGQTQTTPGGVPGASAYDIAVKHGFDGTEEDWLASLKGEPGAPGAPGAPGKPGEDGKDGLAWIDLGTFDDVMAKMDELLEDGRYRLWTDDPFCYSVEVERLGDNYVGQTHWSTEEGRGNIYFRTAWHNGEEWEWLTEWTPHVTQDWLNQYALKTHKHRQAMNADFESWIQTFREGQYQINVQAEAKSYIVDQYVFNNRPVTTIHVCQRYFEISEPWKVNVRHGTTNGNYVLVDWDDWVVCDPTTA